MCGKTVINTLNQYTKNSKKNMQNGLIYKGFSQSYIRGQESYCSIFLVLPVNGGSDLKNDFYKNN